MAVHWFEEVVLGRTLGHPAPHQALNACYLTTNINKDRLLSTKPSQQIRLLIQASALTPYRIAKLAGIRGSLLSVFLSGERTITLDTLDALAPVLGLEVTGDGRDVKLAKAAPKRGRPKKSTPREK